MIKYNIVTIKWCDVCGLMKIVKPYKLQHNEKSFCSDNCMAISYKGRLLLENTKRLISLNNKSGTKEVKEKMRKAHLGKKFTIETKNKLSKIRKKQWQDIDYRRIVISGRMGHEVSEETRKKIAQSRMGDKHWTKRMPYPESAKEKLREARLHQIFPKKDTKPERMLQIALSLERIKFRKHEPILGQPDIFIEPNICIFVDGDYSHGNPEKFKPDDKVFGVLVAEKWARDIKINSKLTMRGYHVIRIWQSEIKKDVGIVAKNIINMIKEIQSKTLQNRRAEL